MEHYHRPIIDITGTLDLLTDNGRAMARVIVAMANKQSLADTGDLGREPVYQELRRRACVSSTRSAPPARKGLKAKEQSTSLTGRMTTSSLYSI
ncbi:hypothetical protein [Streptomyces sp. NPDC001153]